MNPTTNEYKCDHVKAGRTARASGAATFGQPDGTDTHLDMAVCIKCFGEMLDLFLEAAEDPTKVRVTVNADRTLNITYVADEGVFNVAYAAQTT